MTIGKFIVQSIGVGCGVLAVRAITQPGKKKVPRWLFTAHDKADGVPWFGDNEAMRARSRVRKVTDSLESLN